MRQSSLRGHPSPIPLPQAESALPQPPPQVLVLSPGHPFIYFCPTRQGVQSGSLVSHLNLQVEEVLQDYCDFFFFFTTIFTICKPHPSTPHWFVLQARAALTLLAAALLHPAPQGTAIVPLCKGGIEFWALAFPLLQEADGFVSSTLPFILLFHLSLCLFQLTTSNSSSAALAQFNSFIKISSLLNPKTSLCSYQISPFFPPSVNSFSSFSNPPAWPLPV